ncbi:DUF2784 domain-containing protein [Mycobacterium sp. CBMA226]|nr:DUF2784 domain-containing protein [Mycolicibacterium sp. CBMA 226]
MPYSAIAVAAVAAHFAFLGYLVGGGFLAWRWPVTIWLHALVVGWTLIILTGVVECPLTTIERWARAAGGMAPLPRAGFIDDHVAGVLYPRGWGTPAAVAVCAVILASWLGLWRRRTRPAEAAPDRHSIPPGNRRRRGPIRYRRRRAPGR